METLSQAEIDNLINAMTKGITNQDENQITTKRYNFRKPNKFTKDQLRTLFMINENFSRILSNFMSGYLRSTINIKIASVEQSTYEEFLLSIISPTLLTLFQMQPLTGNAVIEFSNNFTSPAIDLLFGGIGRKSTRVKELTEIELRVLRKLSQKILDNMALAWSDVFKFNPVIDAMETNPQFNQIISPNETVVIITFNAEIANIQSMINLCLPYTTLKEAIQSLTAQNWFAAQQNFDVSQIKHIENNLEKVSVNLTAYCGETQLTVKEFLQLEEGDVILLNTIVGDDMSLCVEDKPMFKIQPGIVGNKIATLITGKL
jgi:flagellar motor switch protein FliM